jgi:hypothetical protein
MLDIIYFILTASVLAFALGGLVMLAHELLVWIWEQL